MSGRKPRILSLVEGRVLRDSALKTVADPSFGGSAVQSLSPASQESLKTFLFRLFFPAVHSVARRVGNRDAQQIKQAEGNHQ